MPYGFLPDTSIKLQYNIKCFYTQITKNIKH